MIKRAIAAFAASLTGILMMVLSVHCALAERRVALVFGNSAYQNSALLANTPKNDAEDIAKTLKSLGFDVLLATNTDIASASKAIQQFARSAQNADAALFFFAGHALQYQGENFLLPVDAELRDEISLPFETISLASIRAALDRSRGIKIIMLDASRRNPVAERLAAQTSGRSESANTQTFERPRGVEYADKNDNLIVVFSAPPDSIAADVATRNSPFVTALLQRLNEPGLEIENLFSRVAADVETATLGRQKPVIFSSLAQAYYLNQEDRFAWDRIKTTQDPAVLQDFLEHFPSSYFIFEARNRLNALQKALDAAAERARAEAKEKEERDARQRREAELACQSVRKKLEGLDPHDQAGFRTFSETAPCSEAKTEAKEKLAASFALIAQEAETCRKDNALLASLGGDDLAKIVSLAKNSRCEAVKKAAAEKQSVLETQKKEDDARRLRETETCTNEDAGLKSLIAGSPSEEAIQKLEDLKKQHQCPGLTNPIETALADLRRAAEAACQQDQKALNAIAQRGRESLKAFADRKDLCSTVKESAGEKLAELEIRLTREAETCRKEELAARQLTSKGDAQGLENLRSNVECSLVTAYIDQSLQSINAAKNQICSNENAELTKLVAEASSANGLDPAAFKSKLDRIAALASSAACDSIKAEAQDKLSVLQAALAKREARLAQEEAVCLDERIRWTKLAAAGNSETIKKFRADAKCVRLAPEIDQKIAEVTAACEKETKNLASLGESDHDGLKSFAAAAICEDTKTLAKAKLAALETRLAAEADACRVDQEQWQKVSAQGNKQALEALRDKAKCRSLIPEIDQKIAALASACEKEASNLTRLNEADHDGLKALAASAACEETKNLASAKLASLETKLAHEAETCRKDQEQWQRISAQGSRAALEAFRAKTQCANVIAAIDQKIAALALACDKDSKALASLNEADRNGLQTLAASAICEETRNLAVGKLAALDSRLAQEAETCRKETETFRTLASGGNPTDLQSFRVKAKCSDLYPEIDQRLAGLEADCKKEITLLKGLGDLDYEGLQKFAASAICYDAKQNAKIKLAKLEQTLAQQDKICRGEEVLRQGLANSSNRADLRALKQKLQCSKVIAGLDLQIASLEASCANDQKTLDHLSERDLDGLKTLSSATRCDEIKTNAVTRLSALKTKLDEEAAEAKKQERETKICQLDEEKFKLLADSNDKGKLEALRKHAQCGEIIAKIDEKLTAIDRECGKEERVIATLDKKDTAGMKAYLAHATCEASKNAVRLRLEAALTPQDTAPSPGKHILPQPEAEHHQERHPKREADPKEPAKTKTAAKPSPAPNRAEPSQSAAREAPHAAPPHPVSSSTLHNVPSFGTGF